MRALLADFSRWSSLIGVKPHHELAEIILEESGYTDMWQKDRSADAAGRLENLKELVRSMEEFPDLASFLEHVSLVMDADSKDVGAARLDHDAARRQGPRIRDRLSCRAGRKASFPISVRSMKAAAPASRRSGASPMSASPAPSGRARISLRHQSPHSRPLADDDPLALHRRSARGPCRGDRAAGLDVRRLRRFALRPDGELRLDLRRRRAGSARRSGRARPASRASGFAAEAVAARANADRRRTGRQIVARPRAFRHAASASCI